MGSNRRYGDATARRKANARAELAALAPVSLPEEVVRATGGPPRQAESPVPVRAYVELATGYLVEVEGSAIAWTARAVHVQYVGARDEPQRAWVWASAVRRVDGGERSAAG